MRLSQICLSAMLVLLLATQVEANSKNLTLIERQKGNKAIANLGKKLSKLDEEDSKAYKLLKTNPDYYYVWCRSIADQKNPKKLKALIKQSRKHKLWHTVDWLLDELEELEPLSPQLLLLRALTFCERGDVQQACKSLRNAMERFPWSRRLRRIHYKLSTEKEIKKRKRAITNIFNYEELVDMTFCHRRTMAMTYGMRRFVERYPRRKPSFKPDHVSPENLPLWEKELKSERLLPETYEFNGPCKLATAQRSVPEDLQIYVVCLKHYHQEFVERGEPYTIPFNNWKIDDKILDEAFRSNKTKMAILAAEYVLKKPSRMSRKFSEYIKQLLLSSSVNERFKLLLLRNLEQYATRYDIKDNHMLKAVEDIAANHRGQIRVLASLILRWHNKKYPELNNRELAYLLTPDLPLGLLPFDTLRYDREDMVKKIVTLPEVKTEKRLKAIAMDNLDINVTSQANYLMDRIEHPPEKKTAPILLQGDWMEFDELKRIVEKQKKEHTKN